ncbi:restriction endonuclease subunit S [Acetobacter sp. AAB5]|uniref:restriction endonuclease subunit S n=1 Tax=Acetobacter sp. AAB5 TaxID=3418370 RepID=UPI003CFB1623
MSFPKYPAYKDSGVEWIGEIPVGWDVLPLKRIFSLKNGATPKSGQSDFWDGEITWITPADLNSERPEIITHSKRTISVKGAESCAVSIVPKGSIIISTRAPIGSIGLAGTDLCTNQGCRSLVPDKGVSSKFFLYFFYSAVSELQILGKGTTFLELSSDSLASFLLCFPPLPEQQAIASFLDRECGKLDALIAEQERLIALLAEKRQAVISHAVTKGLNPNASMKDSGIPWIGMVPEGWEMKRIKDCGCRIVDCKNRTPENHPAGKFFVVRTSCIKDGVFIPDSGYFTDEANFVEWTEKGVPQFGDVLFTREAPAGEACLAPENIEFCLGQRMMFIRPLPQILSNKFLLYSIYGGLARERIIERSKGSTVGHLRVGDVGALPLLLPPYETQLAIVDSLEGELSNVRILTDASQKSIVLLKERRAALISAAVTGKIDVRAQSKAVAA